MSKILAAMQKSSAKGVDFAQRLQTIDRGNLFSLPADAQAPEFEQLANSLINLHDGDGGKTVVFASTYPKEGSSFVSYNCARYLTLLLDRKVAWIDGNFRHPHPSLNHPDLNFFDLMTDPQSLPAMGKGPELVLIGNGKKPGKTMDLITGPNYPKLIEHLQENFYFTIIDAAPIMENVEVAHLTKGALGMVLVVESQRLKFEVVQYGIEMMRTQNVNVLGTVLNKRSFHLPDFIYKRL